MKPGGNNNLPGERKTGAMNPDIVALREYEILFVQMLSEGLAINKAAIAVRGQFPDVPFSDSTAQNLAKKPHIIKALSEINQEVNREIALVRTESVRSVLPEFTKQIHAMLLHSVEACGEGLQAMRDLLVDEKAGPYAKTEAMKQIISLTNMLIKNSGVMETQTTEVSREKTSTSQGINRDLFNGILEGVLGVSMKSVKAEVNEDDGDGRIEAVEL